METYEGSGSRYGCVVFNCAAKHDKDKELLQILYLCNTVAFLWVVDPASWANS